VQKKRDSGNRKTLVPENWQLNEKFFSWLREKFPDIAEPEIQNDIEKFRNYSHSNGKAYLNCEAGLRNWFMSPYFQQARAAPSQTPKPYQRLHGSQIVPGHMRQGGILEL
jgi:hypothetical protein